MRLLVLKTYDLTAVIWVNLKQTLKEKKLHYFSCQCKSRGVHCTKRLKSKNKNECPAYRQTDRQTLRVGLNMPSCFSSSCSTIYTHHAPDCQTHANVNYITSALREVGLGWGCAGTLPYLPPFLSLSLTRHCQ